MALIEEEVVAAVAATAAVLSPRARKIARKGAVYGLAGVLKAGDVVVAAARGAARAAEPAAEEALNRADSPPPPGRSAARSPRSRAAKSRSGPAHGPR